MDTNPWNQKYSKSKYNKVDIKLYRSRWISDARNLLESYTNSIVDYDL